ncbi:hypothetical protein COHA_007489 [Chlorella ohadii]|uniref:Uncharacterized protein n=1 Tax=Chlorella ohadii TaxID=2649997 RepID=A0AAD5H451_9CHLO|nr:hypothetical protein COHA_007489 [Chlorella ohadii]
MIRAASCLVLVLLVQLAAASSATGHRRTNAELVARREAHAARALLEGKHKIKLGEKPGPRDTDDKCGEWKVGTATGYSTDGTDKGDLPMAPNDLGEYIVPGKFFKAQNVLAVDSGDWEDARYRYVEVFMEDKHATLETWDLCDGEYTLRAKFCVHKDCAPDNKDCCSSNKKTFTDEDGSGFLLDIETHALKSVWGYDDGHNWLVAPAWYRICDRFDYKKEVDEYDMICMGLKGDKKCGFDDPDSSDSSSN